MWYYTWSLLDKFATCLSWILAIVSQLLIYKKVKCTLVQALRLCTGRTAHRGRGGIALPFHDHGTRRGWGVSVTHRPLSTPGKARYPFCKRRGRPQGRSGQVRKISSTPGFYPWTAQPVASRYTDWATRPPISYMLGVWIQHPIIGQLKELYNLCVILYMGCNSHSLAEISIFPPHNTYIFSSQLWTINRNFIVAYDPLRYCKSLYIDRVNLLLSSWTTRLSLHSELYICSGDSVQLNFRNLRWFP
jgi:hypothetical protein